MKKLDKDGCEYELTIPYENDKDLDETIYYMLSVSIRCALYTL